MLELIASDANGAWTTGDLCKLIYGSTEKRHRVAVNRALRTVTLPGDWCVGWITGGRCLFNECSVESQTRRSWQDGFAHWRLKDFKKDWPHIVDRAREATEKAITYRDATPLQKIEIDLKAEYERAGFAARYGIADLTKYAADRIQQLNAKKAALAAPASGWIAILNDGIGVKAGKVRGTKAEAEKDAESWREHIAALKRKPKGEVCVITEAKAWAMGQSCAVTPHTTPAEDAEIVAKARGEIAPR